MSALNIKSKENEILGKANAIFFILYIIFFLL